MTRPTQPTDIDAILRQREELKRRDPDAILLFLERGERGPVLRAYSEDASWISEHCPLTRAQLAATIAWRDYAFGVRDYLVVGIAPAGMCDGDDRVQAYLVETRDGRARVELPCGSVIWVEGAAIS